MNKCLNCNKDVVNKYCNVACQNEHRGKLNIEKYYENPKLCVCCSKIIEYKYSANKFCSHSCSAIVNNAGIKRCSNNINNSKILSFSDSEFISIINESLNWNEIFKKFGYRKKGGSTSRSIISKRIELLSISLNFETNSIKNKTKRELFDSRNSWQSARSGIRKDACNVFKASGKEYKCIICGYSNHVDIAHIKPVSEFNDNDLISDINNINNLVALCPNHHWEFDAELINL